MYLDGWQANAQGEDVATALKQHGAADVCELGPDSSGWPAFAWRSYVDHDDDVVNVLAIMLWYNDRSDEQIEDARVRLRAWLAANPRS